MAVFPRHDRTFSLLGEISSCLTVGKKKKCERVCFI